MIPKKKNTVGVVVGRFQTPMLHEGHCKLLNDVFSREHEAVIIFIGVSSVRSTRNPLTFAMRRDMIAESYPNAIILPLADVPNNDPLWSKNVDAAIGTILTPKQSAVLYGSRDSFIPHYSGRFPTEDIVMDCDHRATDIRETIVPSNSRTFRQGVIWSMYHRYPAVVPTVDIAIFNEDYTQVLLGRKATETRFRFIGGFADRGSGSYEVDAKREAQEETNLEVGQITYVCSTNIDDPRYRGPDAVIRTTFFHAKKIMGHEQAMDDIVEVRWFPYATLSQNDIVETHHILLEKLRETINQ